MSLRDQLYQHLVAGPRHFFCLLAVTFGSTVAFSQPVPDAEDFQINTYTTNIQFLPSVGSLCDRFIVAWASRGSTGTDTSSFSAQGRILESSGTSSVTEFQINTYTTSYATRPKISDLSCSSFVVVWGSDGSPGNDDSLSSILGQRFNSDGSNLGSEFQVNTYTTQAQWYPDVDTGRDGKFLVVWQSDGSQGTDISGSSIQGQLYSAAGVVLGGEFQINSDTTGDQRNPSVAALPSGGFYVVWTGLDGSASGIKGLRYDASGVPTTPEFQINTYTSGFQDSAEVAVGSSGDAMVVWTRGGEIPGDPTSVTVRAQLFDPTGNFSGIEFLVSTNTSVLNGFADVAVIGRNDFFFVWQSADIATGNNDISGQFYSSGKLLPNDLLINSYTTGAQVAPMIESLPTGKFLASWSSEASPGTDDSLDSIIGRLFSSPVQARAIPTIGGLGLTILSGLLAGCGFRYMRSRSKRD